MLAAVIPAAVLGSSNCYVDFGLPEVNVTCPTAPIEWGSDRLDYRATLNVANQSLTSHAFLDTCSYTAVEYLNLEGNAIATLPLSGLTGLRGLNLARNRISMIDNTAFAEFTLLRHIDLQSNKITFIESGAFTGLDFLVSLDLRSNWIEMFDYHIVDLDRDTYLPDLTVIDLRNQSNGSPTCTFTQLALYESDNGCPAETAGAQRPCSGHWACPEPATVCRPTLRPNQNRELRCFNFDAVPDAEQWGTDEIQESIRLAHNNLSVIPHTGFKDCPHTEATALYLNNNSITRVGGHAFSTLTRLRLLDLSDNPVEYISRGGLSGLTALETLLMRNMHLAIFDFQQLIAYHSLARVDLSNQLYGYADCEGKSVWDSHADFISSLSRCNPIEPSCPGGDMGCVLPRPPYALAGVEMPVPPKADAVGTAGIVALAVVTVGILAGYAIHRRRQSVTT